MEPIVVNRNYNKHNFGFLIAQLVRREKDVIFAITTFAMVSETLTKQH